MPSLKDQLAAIRPARTQVDCAGLKVFVRRMTKLERLQSIIAEQDLKADPVALLKHYAMQLVKHVEDEAGVPVWTEQDLDTVMGLAEHTENALNDALYGPAPKN